MPEVPLERFFFGGNGHCMTAATDSPWPMEGILTARCNWHVLTGDHGEKCKVVLPPDGTFVLSHFDELGDSGDVLD